jgi:hypothetical protein
MAASFAPKGAKAETGWVARPATPSPSSNAYASATLEVEGNLPGRGDHQRRCQPAAHHGSGMPIFSISDTSSVPT